MSDSIDDYSEMLYEVLEHYGWDLPYRHSGWKAIKCGAHGDSHASCNANFDEGALRCMACGFAGNTFTIVRQLEGTDNRGTYRKLEEIANGVGIVLRQPDRRSGGVSARTRDLASKRGYTPPRLRSKSRGGA